MPTLPEGTVTFLFTDIEGSTRMWEQHPYAMAAALARHDALLREAIETNGGYVFKTVGDAFCAAFPTAPEALQAALDAQRSLQPDQWGEWGETGPIRVRMALHTGACVERDGDYFGPPVNRVARLLSAVHGGQTVLSHATRQLLIARLPTGVELLDFGERRLKDLIEPVRVFQVTATDLPRDFPPLKTLDSHPNNLPAQPNPFIGREREVASARDLLRRSGTSARPGQAVRLLTFTGPGGTGKTRLALQVAADLVDEFEHGVWFVSLAPVRDPALVPAAVAQALGVKETAGQSVPDALRDHLHDKHVLLLLDNFEQVVDAALAVSELLAAAPHLKVLVTSRETLRIHSEFEFPVPPLETPDLSRLPPLDALAQYPAVALFVQRAQAAQRNFALTAANAPAVAGICARLDGLPLAIELAAARTRVLTAQAIVAKLQSRLKLLTGGVRDLPARHQTLRSVMEWSYDLLNASERLLFSRLGVFAGGCSLEAVEAVCGGTNDEAGSAALPPLEFDILDGLSSLVDKSLIRQREGAGEEPRFVMLETIREYAVERLLESGEQEAIRRRHAEYFVTLAQLGEPGLKGPDQLAWLNRFEEEHDNLRAALEWAKEQGEQGDPEPAVRLGASMWRFWRLRGHLFEGRRWLSNILTLPGMDDISSQSLRARRTYALFGAGQLALGQGDISAAKLDIEQSMAAWRELGDDRNVALAFQNLGVLAFGEGDYATARKCHEEGLKIIRAVGDRHIAYLLLNSLGVTAYAQRNYPEALSFYEECLVASRELGDKRFIATTLNNLGNLNVEQGEYAEAHAPLEEGLALYRELGDKHNAAEALINLAMVFAEQGDLSRSHTLCIESLDIRRELGDRKGVAECLEALAWVVCRQGKASQTAANHAVRLWSVAAAQRDAMGVVLPPVHHARHDAGMAAARSALGDDEFESAWQAGRALPVEQAIAETNKTIDS